MSVVLHSNKLMSSFVLGFALVAAMGLACAQVGCGGGGGGPGRYDLSGTVTFDGKPVPFGQIVFSPDASAGNSGPQGAAEILNGKYNTAGKGTIGGPHVVHITGLPSKPTAANEENPIQPLFPEYRTNADLPKQKSTMDFEVPASAATAAPAAGTAAEE